MTDQHGRVGRNQGSVVPAALAAFSQEAAHLERVLRNEQGSRGRSQHPLHQLTPSADGLRALHPAELRLVRDLGRGTPEHQGGCHSGEAVRRHPARLAVNVIRRVGLVEEQWQGSEGRFCIVCGENDVVVVVPARVAIERTAAGPTSAIAAAAIAAAVAVAAVAVAAVAATAVAATAVAAAAIGCPSSGWHLK